MCKELRIGTELFLASKRHLSQKWPFSMNSHFRVRFFKHEIRIKISVDCEFLEIEMSLLKSQKNWRSGEIGISV